MSVVKGSGGGGSSSVSTGTAGGPLGTFYQTKIDRLENDVQQEVSDLRRLQAQRNQLNSRVKQLRDELMMLREPGMYVCMYVCMYVL